MGTAARIGSVAGASARPGPGVALRI